MPESGLYSVETWSREESVGYLINAVRARLIGSLDAELARHDITGAQWATLIRIAESGSCTAAELCRMIGCDTGSMTRMLDRLEEKGLVRRSRSTEDRRVVNVVPTEEGRALPPQVLPAVVGVLNRYLDGFSSEELELLKGLLRRMLANGGRSGT